MPRLDKGDKAPAFTLNDHDGKKVSLSSFAGSRIVVYFYPADDTPGCTKEACQFTDNLSAFAAAKVSVIGISPDDAATHRAFRSKYGLKLTLLSDPKHLVMEKYGAWGDKTLYGHKSIGVIRSTFLIDPKGRLERVWYNVRSDGHAAKVLEVASGLKPNV